MAQYVDVRGHYSPNGRIYMPSQPWGIRGYMTIDGELLYKLSDSAATLAQAIEKAAKLHPRRGGEGGLTCHMSQR